jgi:hypothetical protein
MKNKIFNLVIVLGLVFCLIFCVLQMKEAKNNLQLAIQQIDNLQDKNETLNSENINLNNVLNNKNNELVDMTNKFHSAMEQLQLANDKLNQQDSCIENLNQEIIALQESLFGHGQELDIIISQSDVEMIAKTIWGEARGQSTMEQAAVIWCILNRVDRGDGTIAEVITKPNQFVGYRESNPVKEEFCELAKDVLARWQMEKVCRGEVGRVLPNNYYYFYGDGIDNHFRDKYKGDYTIWNWDCWNPYE